MRFLLLFVGLFLSTSAFAQTSAFYVATNGSDSNPGTFSAPFATLTKAQAAMRANRTIRDDVHPWWHIHGCYAVSDECGD